MITKGKILIETDNKELQKSVMNDITVANHFNQDAAAESKVIRRLIKELKIPIIINNVKSYRKRIKIYERDLRTNIIRVCHIRVNKERENTKNYPNKSNIKYMGDEAIVQDNKIVSRSTNEIIRMTDAIKEEKQYFKKKFNEKADIINIRA